ATRRVLPELVTRRAQRNPRSFSPSCAGALWARQAGRALWPDSARVPRFAQESLAAEGAVGGGWFFAPPRKTRSSAGFGNADRTRTDPDVATVPVGNERNAKPTATASAAAASAGATSDTRAGAPISLCEFKGVRDDSGSVSTALVTLSGPRL